MTRFSLSQSSSTINAVTQSKPLVPLAPYKLSSRPWLVSDESTVTIEPIHTFKDAAIVIDGRHTEPVNAGDAIVITKADEPALFVTTGWRFYEKVRSKL